MTRSFMRPLRIHVLIIVLSLFWAAMARADTIFYPVITYSCNTAADRIDISYTMLQGAKGKNFPYSDAKGTYSPWKMVDFKTAYGQRTVTHRSKITKVCKLSSGDFTVTIVPHVFDSSVGDHCGDSISAAVSIYRVDDEILPPTPFEGFCLGNEPIISKIRVIGKTAQVKIKRAPKYTFY